jgi:hypothetical protein
MPSQFEQIISALSAELMNRSHYSRDNVAAAYRAYLLYEEFADPVKAAVDSLNLPVIEEDN